VLQLFDLTLLLSAIEFRNFLNSRCSPNGSSTTPRERIRRGELSEASLAGLIGYSQPHIHNVLKGQQGAQLHPRRRSPGALRPPLAALFSRQELSSQRPRTDSEPLPAILLRVHLGGGAPYPVSPRLRMKISLQYRGLLELLTRWHCGLAPTKRRCGPSFNLGTRWPLIWLRTNDGIRVPTASTRFAGRTGAISGAVVCAPDDWRLVWTIQDRVVSRRPRSHCTVARASSMWCAAK